ncbi:MAG: response regulator [Desulfobacterales bacterium]|nr:response regulator [Desulfobacterales bacterium]
MADYLILIVDDEKAQHMILGDYLKLSGYKVAHAYDGAEGLKMLEELKPNLVILDVQMPGMDGFQTLQEIKKKAAHRNVAVLFLTALERQHLKIKGLELGADDYITKPFDRAELLARINAVLRRSDRSRQLEGIMEGDLADVGIADLLQSMELGVKTATIVLGEIGGEILVKNGELLYVSQGTLTGDQALIRIFLLEKGAFSIKFNELSKTVSEKPRGLTSVLMNISNEVDEIKDIINKLHVDNRLIKIVGDVSEFPEIDKIRELTPMTFTEMIVAMDGNSRDNIKILAAASKSRKLKIEK